jgi:predicted transcriptional regulator
MNSEPQTTLSPTQLRILLELAKHGTATAPELARAIASEEAAVAPSTSTVQTILLRLQRNGLVVSTKTTSHRWWQLSAPAELPALLRKDARSLLLSRYGAHPIAIQALLEEIQRLLPLSAETRRLA